MFADIVQQVLNAAAASDGEQTGFAVGKLPLLT
jgi:hypothetical protein